MTAILIAALCVSAAGNAVLGVTAYLQTRTMSAVLRLIPEYRERATAGTARIWSRWSATRREEGGRE